MSNVRHVMENRLLTTTEVAQILGCSERTVLRLVTRGDLPAAQKLPSATGTYLFESSEVAALQKARKVS